MLFQNKSQPMHQIKFSDDQKRLLMYCASDVGLGHFSRLSRIGQHLHKTHPEIQILFLTDIIPQASGDFAEHFGVIKLPGYAHSEKYPDSSGLKLPHQTLFQMRQNLIMNILQSYQPHFFLMDTGPHGKKNELEKPLRYLQKKSPETYRVMMMRDIPIPPEEYWEEKVPYRTKMLNEHDLYDFFLISGHPNLFNIAEEYKWKNPLQDKLKYCGLIVPEVPKPNGDGDTEESNQLLISFGGGWDSEFLASEFSNVIPRLVDQGQFDVHVVTGPKISDKDFQLLKDLELKYSQVIVDKFRGDFPEILEQSKACFLQAGSTIYQILDSDKPVAMYTRDYTTKEQEVRVDLLRKFSDIHVLNKASFKNDGILKLLLKLMTQDRKKRESGLTFNGVSTATKVIQHCLAHKKNADLSASVSKIVSS